jgi:hypothetical protein
MQPQLETNQETPTQPTISRTDALNIAVKMLGPMDRDKEEVAQVLIAKGFERSAATIIADEAEDMIDNAERREAKKDMIWGAVWCLGGLILTMSDTGYIFWGAIVFGGYQFIRGAVKL